MVNQSKEFAEAIVALFGSWNRPMTSEAIDAFYLVLGDLPVEQIKSGVIAACRQGGPHPPSAGDLLKICTGTSGFDLKLEAEKEFKELEFKARTTGRSFDVRTLGSRTRYAIGAMGGWDSFCTTTDQWQKKNFLAGFVEYSESREGHKEIERYKKPAGELQDLRSQLTNSVQVKGQP